MQKQLIGKTNLQSSKIIYGCMNIGGSWDNSPLTKDVIKNVNNIIDTCLEHEINMFDHADIYTRGKSEEAFGKVIKERKELLNSIIIQTKCGIRFPDDPEKGFPGRYDFTYEHIIDSVNNSLKKLNVEKIDILLLHRPDPLVNFEELAKAFDKLESDGKVSHFGVSNQNRFQIELMQKFIDQKIEVNQLEFNLIHNGLIDEGVSANQHITTENLRAYGTLEFCRQNDITIQAYSPIAKGTLADRNSDVNKPLIDELIILSEKYNVDIDAVALNWILKHPAKIQPVIGTTKPERIKSAVKSDQFEITREEWYQLFIEARKSKMP